MLELCTDNIICVGRQLHISEGEVTGTEAASATVLYSFLMVNLHNKVIRQKHVHFIVFVLNQFYQFVL